MKNTRKLTFMNIINDSFLILCLSVLYLPLGFNLYRNMKLLFMWSELDVKVASPQNSSKFLHSLEETTCA